MRILCYNYKMKIARETSSQTLIIPDGLVDNLDVQYYELSPNHARAAIIKLGREANRRCVRNFATHLNSERSLNFQSIEPTDAQSELESEARDFVEVTVGLVPYGDIFWQKAEIPGTDAYSAFFAGAYGATFIRSCPDICRDYERLRDMTCLIHELAHSTGYTRKMVGFSTQTNVTTGTTHGADINKIFKHEERWTMCQSGEFFEEAFAEETAARYRDSKHHSAHS